MIYSMIGLLVIGMVWFHLSAIYELWIWDKEKTPVRELVLRWCAVGLGWLATILILMLPR